MTSTAVKELSAMYVGGSTSGQVTKTPANLTESFTKVMEKTTGSQVETSVSEKSNQGNQKKVETDTKKTEENQATDSDKKVDSKVTDTEKTESTDTDATDTTETKTDAISEKLTNATDELATKANELIGIIAKQLGVSEEEVVAMMEQMGLTTVDLLNTDNITELCLNLTGNADMLSLLTNEELYNNVTKLLETVTDMLGQVQNQNQLTDDEMRTVLQQLSAETEGQEEANPDNKIKIVTMDVVNEESESDVNESKETLVLQNETDGKVTKNQNIQNPDIMNTEETVKVVEGEGFTENQSAGGQAGSESSQSFMQNLTNQNTQGVQANLATSEEVANLLEQTRTEDILKQLTDTIKVQLKPEITQMEMQLNPANLGTVNLQISSRQGIISAQLTVQNETVKEALESQIVQLRESMNEQGLKVESVEVTVESHAFERNLDQNQNQENTADESNKKSTRRINLDDLDSLDMDELDEADRIAVEMMEQSGNTVDFTV